LWTQVAGVPLQLYPEAQSPLFPQLVLQARIEPSHLNGVQSVALATHSPVPLHVDDVRVVPALQVIATQTVPAG
jgi:hypothetical protein